MRLAFYNYISVPWGGSEILWTSTAEEALNQKHEVLISVFDWPKQHHSVDILRCLGATVIYRRIFYPPFLTRLRKKAINLLFPWIRKITYNDYFNSFKSDHIFFNLAGGDEIATNTSDLMLFIEQTSIPFSVFYHSLSLEKYLTDIHTDNFKYLLSKAQNNFFTSQMQIDLLEEQLDFRIDNTWILNHPLRDIKELSVENDVINFCIIGSLVSRWKGQDNVIKILAKERWRHLNWHLNIYGDGPDRNELLQLVKSKNLSSKITLHHHTEDINEIFANNCLVLIPSKQDSGPIVLFESMLAGKPVVGSFMGVMPDYIVSGVNGVLAEGVDEFSFEKAMCVAWENKENWKKWGKNAREQILQRYDFESIQTLLGFITTT